MTPSEFVFWMRGFMQAESELTPERLKVLRGVLEDVDVPKLPRPQEAWREELRLKLAQEREEFLKTLPPLEQWERVPAPPFIVTCEGTR